MKNTQQNKITSVVDASLLLNEQPRMKKIKLYVKNMVTIRCKLLVESILEDEEIPYNSVELGEIELPEMPSPDKLANLKRWLTYYELVLMDDHKSILVERIKAVVIEMVHQADQFPNVKHSTHISKKLNHNYTYLANLFSEVKGITLERFIILHKIERVKELILYDELNLSEIACKLNYSSVGHLSNQFKQITGLTPSHFKKIKNKRQCTLEDL